ncbi:ABC transporter permease [Sporolactobacillus sp. CQH2019]|uniref:ABC transporter permease n=1 Tax=Sporolactobacillus sp. CQH2019 TaxID=3023512 RepID=UPI00236828AB|nr:ABC transporter permease [Sporolactobacillus sp. CQH2019]MDD9149578.1 ABC transporter permease [Sporolactobacillus sp. CQH2019]
MKIIHETRLLFWRKMLETLREPVWIFTGLSTPLLYLILFAPLLKGLHSPVFGSSSEVLDVFVPGILVLMAFGAGMGSGWEIIGELQNGVTERFRVTPVSRFSLLMGPVLRDTVMFLVPAMLILAIAAVFGFPIHPAGLVLLLILLALLTAVISAASNSLGMILKNIGSLAAIVTGMQLPLTLLAGVLLPLSFGPKWLQLIAHFNPLFYDVEAARVLANGTLLASRVYEAFLIMIILTALVLCWSTRVYRKAIS